MVSSLYCEACLLYCGCRKRVINNVSENPDFCRRIHHEIGVVLTIEEADSLDKLNAVAQSQRRACCVRMEGSLIPAAAAHMIGTGSHRWFGNGHRKHLVG